jgi:hypothetical protein
MGIRGGSMSGSGNKAEEGGSSPSAEASRCDEDPNAPIIVDAPPDSPEFGVVEIPGTGKIGPLLELLQDLGRFFK